MLIVPQVPLEEMDKLFGDGRSWPRPKPAAVLPLTALAEPIEVDDDDDGADDSASETSSLMGRDRSRSPFYAEGGSLPTSRKASPCLAGPALPSPLPGRRMTAV